MSWIRCLFDIINAILFTKGKDVENYDVETKINNMFFVPCTKRKKWKSRQIGILKEEKEK